MGSGLWWKFCQFSTSELNRERESWNVKHSTSSLFSENRFTRSFFFSYPPMFYCEFSLLTLPELMSVQLLVLNPFSVLGELSSSMTITFSKRYGPSQQVHLVLLLYRQLQCQCLKSTVISFCFVLLRRCQHFSAPWKPRWFTFHVLQYWRQPFRQRSRDTFIAGFDFDYIDGSTVSLLKDTVFGIARFLCLLADLGRWRLPLLAHKSVAHAKEWHCLTLTWIV